MQQVGALAPEQLGRGEIQFVNQPVAVEAEIADRGEVVQLGVVVPRRFQCRLRRAQILILDLEFDLMQVQIMHQSLGLIASGCRESLLSIADETNQIGPLEILGTDPSYLWLRSLRVK